MKAISIQNTTAHLSCLPANPKLLAGCSGQTLLGICLLFLLSLMLLPSAHGQRYRLTSSHVSFYSEAPLEDIEAHNREAKSIFDAQTGEIAFVIPIRGFQFAKSLMQEHFNENYLESDRYPHAKFEGTLSGYDHDMKGAQQVTAEGRLTIHGVTHPVRIPGKVVQSSSQISMNASFPVKVADYDIEIPSIVFYNIAEEVEVTVEFTYDAENL